MKRKPRADTLGVTDEEYARLLAAQGGGCAICGNPPKTRRLHVDHDHATGAVRGLLCHRCNRALPTYVTPAWLLTAAVYLGATWEDFRDAVPSPVASHQGRLALRRSTVDDDRDATSGTHRVGAGGSPLVNVEPTNRAPGVERTTGAVAGNVEPRAEGNHGGISGDGARAGPRAGPRDPVETVRRDEDPEAIRRRLLWDDEREDREEEGRKDAEP